MSEGLFSLILLCKRMKIGLVIGCCFLFHCIGAQVNLNYGLGACYSFDGNAFDPINNNNGLLNNIINTGNRFNNSNMALAFGGNTTSYIELPSNVNVKPSNAFSFSCWLRYNLSTLSNCVVLFTKNNQSTNIDAYSLSIANNNGSYKFLAKKSSAVGANSVYSTTSVTPNTWFHVVATIDNNNMVMYVNGVMEASTSVSFNGFDYMAGKNVYLGGTNENSFNQPFQGSIDNARFYDRAINAAEVNYLYILDPVCVTQSMSPVSSFSLSTDTLCSNQLLHVIDQSSNTPTSWLWSCSNCSLTNANSNNPFISFSSTGVQTVGLIASNTNGSGSIVTQTLMVMPIPIVSISGYTTLCPGETRLYTASGAVNYIWPANPVCFNSPSPVVGPTVYVGISTVGNFPLFVNGADAFGCVGSKTITIRRVSDCFVFGIKEEDFKNRITLSPNPAHNELNIENNSGKIINYYLHNAIGNQIREGIVEEKIKINLSDLARGVYILELQQLDDRYRQKIIVE